ncbi:MAG: [FeFe] hydrogenase, group A [Clostridiales bacterium]|nr:[FeFe] hydrogenase, group A [Clostridiales bacterium]
MVNITINNIPIAVEEGTTIMEACKEAKMPVPSLCYLKGINEIGACRVCVVEVKGIERLVTSCNNVVKEGMEILTNSPKVREARRINIKLILSQHNCFCPTCVRSGNCQLQKIAGELEFGTGSYPQHITYGSWPSDFPLIRDESKCIKCMRCIQICDKVQSLRVWDLAKTGSRTTVDVSLRRNIKEADCALCGQCITHCPVGALTGRDDKRPVFSQNGFLNAKGKTTVVQVAPAVRTAWAESFNLSRKFASPRRLAGALRMMGFDYVFDTTFAADLTIMEEASEFLERLNHKEDYHWPMFTSCCPGWVRFLKSQYPDMVDCLSTAKSPQQMHGAIIKNYFADKIHEDPENIFSVSIMPCIAKKAECALPTMDSTGTGPDVDVVLNTREFVNYLRSLNIDIYSLPEDDFDSPCGDGTGAGVIFGATGGVMEAALRTCYKLATGENPDPDAFYGIRGMDGWREASIDIAGTTVKIAVVSGLGNARRLIEAVRKGRVFYHFVEVMACPGGCVGGGGQPIHEGREMAEIRSKNLYFLDSRSELRFSHENPEIQKVYDEYLEKPLSRMAHKLLHTDHTAWEMPPAPPRRK